MRVFYVIFILLLTFRVQALAQTTGKVLDAETGLPVAGAIIKSGEQRTESKEDGSFSLIAADSLTVSAIGYSEIKMAFLPGKTNIIRLHPLTYDLSEVTITAFFSPQKLNNTAAAVSAIPVGKLQQSDDNIAASLSGQPGVVMQEGTASTVKLTLRGIGSRYTYGTKKIKAFFEGIPLYSAEGETTFDDISPDYLQRIELLRGPASSVYGASLGGTMILHPKRADFDGAELRYSNSVGSFGNLKNAISYSNNKSDQELVAGISTNKSDGYRENNSYNRKSFLISYHHNFGTKLSGSLLLTGSAIESQIPSSIDSATFVNNPESAAPRWLKTKGYEHPDRIMGGYSLDYRITDKWKLASSIFATSHQTEENRPFNFLNESGISYGGRVVAMYQKTGEKINYQINFGTNLYFENATSLIHENIGGEGVKGDLQQNGQQNIRQNDLFAQWEMQFKKIILTAGINLNSSGFSFDDRFSEDSIDQSGQYDFDLIVSPRVAVSWNPVRNIHLYSAVNHGFSTPALSETLSPLGLINREIKPEQAFSYEAGARMKLFREKTFIDLALYRMKVNDLIVPKRIAEDVYVGMNAGSSLHRGIELSVQQWLWGKGKAFEVIGHLNGTINRFTFLEYIDNGIDYAGKNLPGMPDQQLSCSIDMKSKTGFYFQLELLASGKMPLNDLNSKYADEYTVINGSAGYSITFLKRWTADAMLKMSNLTDSRYASMVVVNAPGTITVPPRYYYPGLPRHVSFSLGIGYRFVSD